MAEYAPNHFFTSSSDRQGHNADARVKFSPELAARCSAIVQSKLIPDYRTTADIFRDALFHRLAYIEDQFLPDEATRNALALHAHICRVENLTRSRATANELVESVVLASRDCTSQQAVVLSAEIDEILLEVELTDRQRDDLRHAQERLLH